MPGRRLIILLVLLLISLSVLSATRDVSRTRLPGSTTTTTTTTPSTATGPKARPAPSTPPAPRDEAVAGGKAVRVRAPGSGITRVPLGSRVIITVESKVPEIVAVEPFGVRAPVDPAGGGTLDFIASSTGRFPVTLAISGRRIGELEVQD